MISIGEAFFVENFVDKAPLKCGFLQEGKKSLFLLSKRQTSRGEYSRKYFLSFGNIRVVALSGGFGFLQHVLGKYEFRKDRFYLVFEVFLFL